MNIITVPWNLYIPIGIFVCMPRDATQTKSLIIDHALPIFNTKGYNAASISDIVSATGITKGAIYGNFKNKDEVATAAFDRGVEIIMSQISDRIRARLRRCRCIH